MPLIYIAVGDAYGASREFVEPKDQGPNDGKTYGKHPQLPLGNGRYTDDAQMSIAVVRAMLSGGRIPRKPIKWADFFHETYKRDPRPGYSSGFAKLLDSTENGEDLLLSIVPHSVRSGAPMRSAVLGAYSDVSTVLRLTAEQAAITHNTPIAIECARAVALAFHYLVHRKGPREKLGEFVNFNLGSPQVDWTHDRREWASVDAEPCTRNAITAWRDSTSASEVLKNAIRFGGDVDTVAAIAMALAWADPTIANDLDPELLDGLEAEPYGFQYLHDKTAEYVEMFLK